jgi:hypothetical protein
MALRGRRINYFFLVMVPSGFKSGGHFIFKKVTSAGLNSLQQKEYQISVKNWIFDDPFPKKGPISVFF